MVDGVLTDYNGREQRASKTIELGGKVTDCELVLDLPKRFYEVGESIPIKISPTQDGDPVEISGTVVAMRLSKNNVSSYGYDGYSPYSYSYGHGFGGIRINIVLDRGNVCLLYTSPSPRDRTRSRMPSSA